MARSRKVSRNQKLVVSNPEKLLYPAAHFTKAQVIGYYMGVSQFLLPHLRDRPVTLKRYPDGVHGDFFYEKDAPEFTPKWVKTFSVPRREGGPDIRYILINDVATLAWVANISSIELHPFLHRAPSLERPTLIVFDLDPGEGAAVLECAEVALLLRHLLQRLQLKSFAKVSGSKGIQVYVPLNRAGITYEMTQPFARAIAEMLERNYPDRIVADMSKMLRRDKVFIDWSQNADHKTTVGVYSLRAKRPRPYVSLPVDWRELQTALRKQDRRLLDFPPDLTLERLRKIGDLFRPVLRLKQHLPRQFIQRTTLPVGPTLPAARSTAQTKPPKSLVDYEAKRRFDRTREPAPAPRRSRQGSRRRFVVQKHAASHLHYDFRLEMHDVLKSWAMPHGLPMARGGVHSAFQTEDHPIEYLEFEGIIPEGEYGGGTVMVWDLGTYEVVEGNYWKGRLSVFLSGAKLKGEWLLERGEDERGKTKWLVTKIDAAKKRLSSKRTEVSALTGRTIEQIAREKLAVWRSDGNAQEKQTPNAEHRTRNAQRSTPDSRRADALGRPTGRRSAASPPKFIPPMKATPVEKLPSGEEWIYEIKWDGYRALAIKEGEAVRLLSAKDKSLASDFPTVVDAVGKIDADIAMVDGEIVAVNAAGKPSFQMLQNRKSIGREWQVVYYAFDLLNLNGEDLRRHPLCERKGKLQSLLGDSGVRYSAELKGNPDSVVESIKAAGLEGVMAKQRNSVYDARTRSTSWLKLRLGLAQEFVIGGYNPEPQSFQSLLVGYYAARQLIFAGKVRQGFNPPLRQRLLEIMRPLESKKCPFTNLPSSKKGHFGEGVTAEEMKKLKWLKPKLVAQVRFAEWTSYGLLRHATFLGLREDKDAREVRRE